MKLLYFLNVSIIVLSTLQGALSMEKENINDQQKLPEERKTAKKRQHGAENISSSVTLTQENVPLKDDDISAKRKRIEPTNSSAKDLPTQASSNTQLSLKPCSEDSNNQDNPPDPFSNGLKDTFKGLGDFLKECKHYQRLYKTASQYAKGKGVEKDIPKAIDLYKQAFAAEGDLKIQKAAYRLGRLYEEGKEVPKDIEKALKYYAEADTVESDMRLGLLYEEGKEVVQDLTKAFNYYVAAANGSSCAEAEFKVGLMYEEGRGVNKDIASAYVSYINALEAHDAQGDYPPLTQKLIAIFEESSTPLDLTQVFIGVKRAALDNGSIIGHFYLASMYMYGKGTEKDLSAALKILKKGAKTNDIKFLFLGCNLLVNNFSHFTDAELESFLSMKQVNSYLQTDTNPETNRSNKVLQALCSFYGWGQKQDQALAFTLLEDSKIQPQTPLEKYLLWRLFDEAGHLLCARKITSKTIRPDTVGLGHLGNSAKALFPLAIKAFNEAGEFSGLLINNLPLNNNNNVFMDVSEKPRGFPKTLKEHLQNLAASTRRIATHYYLPTGLATALQKTHIQAISGAMLTAIPATARLQDVYSHIFANARLKQIESAEKGEKLFVNLSTLQRDTLLEKFFIPLEGEIPMATPEKIALLKERFKAWYAPLDPAKPDVKETKKLDIFFGHIQNEPIIEEKNRLVARIDRISKTLESKDSVTQATMTWALVGQGGETCDQRAQRAITQVEVSLLAHKAMADEDDLLQEICMGLANFRLDNIRALAHRPDHNGNVEEERYYEIILRKPLSLPVHQSKLNHPGPAANCLKPLHAARVFLDGDGNIKALTDPNTYIDFVLTLLNRAKPGRVVRWIANNLDDRARHALEAIAQRPEMAIHQDDPKRLEEACLWAYVATEDFSKVNHDFVRDLLMHPKLNYLTDQADYN